MKLILYRISEDPLHDLKIRFKCDVVYTQILSNPCDIFEGIGRHKTMIECDSEDPYSILTLKKIEGKRAVFPAAVSHQDVIRGFSAGRSVCAEEFLEPVFVLFPLTVEIFFSLELAAVDAKTRTVNSGRRNRGRESAVNANYKVRGWRTASLEV